MAYMRGDPYIYDSTRGLEIYAGGEHVVLPHERADELALMRVSEWDEAKLAEVAQRVVELHGGNIGASPIVEALGGPTFVEMVREAVEALTGGE